MRIPPAEHDLLSEVPSRAARLWLGLCLTLPFLVALATDLYTLQTNRRTFMRRRHQAERLQAQSQRLSCLSWKLIDIQEEALRGVSRDIFRILQNETFTLRFAPGQSTVVNVRIPVHQEALCRASPKRRLTHGSEPSR